LGDDTGRLAGRDVAPEREIEALIYTPEELKRLSGRRLIATALREGEVIFEST